MAHELDALILEAAGRREVRASFEAGVFHVSVDEARKAIKRLRSKKLIWQSSKPLRNFFGSSEAGYRSVEG